MSDSPTPSPPPSHTPLGLCPKCRYPMDPGTCPECGTISLDVTPRPSRLRSLANGCRTLLRTVSVPAAIGLIPLAWAIAIAFTHQPLSRWSYPGLTPTDPRFGAATKRFFAIVDHGHNFTAPAAVVLLTALFVGLRIRREARRGQLDSGLGTGFRAVTFILIALGVGMFSWLAGWIVLIATVYNE